MYLNLLPGDFPAMSTARTVARYTAIATALAIAAVSTGVTMHVTTLHAKPAPTAGTIEPSSRWLEGLKAKHKQFFDSPAPAGGIPLVHVMNYYDTYNKAFGVKDADIDAVLPFYGATTFYGLNDAVWAKYRLGEFLETNDPATGQPATSNPWRAAPVILGMTLPPASIESLQKRGVTLILCNNALQIFSGMLAAKRGLETRVVYEDLKANILPGVELVPAMVIAVEQAARAGLSYHRQ
jgi:intracellular sulfur oxidation DsrE/DsrF family protein